MAAESKELVPEAAVEALIERLRTECEGERVQQIAGELEAALPEIHRAVVADLLDDEDRARLELIRDHDGNDLSENDKALLTRLIGQGDGDRHGG